VRDTRLHGGPRLRLAWVRRVDGRPIEQTVALALLKEPSSSGAHQLTGAVYKAALCQPSTSDTTG